MDEVALIQAATAVRQRAYVPYSHFAVGAAVATEIGIITGCNVENASYGLTLCAERNAIFSAIAQGAKQFTGLAVIADTAGPTAPCGACRQVLAEFMAPESPVILTNMQGQTQRTTVAALLPGAFTKGDLS